MKPSSASPARPAKSRSALVCALLNQLATPGLGSWLAGRRFAGTCQLLLAFTGFGLLFGWFVQVALSLFHLARSGYPAPPPDTALAKAGLAIFALAWIWSGFTSLQLLRDEARRRKPSLPAGDPPPVIQ